MGCNNSKREENTHTRWLLASLFGTKNKILPINVPAPEKAVPSPSTSDSEVMNIVRKTEQTALLQLQAEGIVPATGGGGVAFVVEVGAKAEPEDAIHALPGVPEYKRKYPQYATYSREACQALTYGLPGHLPPLDRSKSRAAIDRKMEKASINRERKIAERKARWAKKYAKIQAAAEKTPSV